jgi:hypothetical protein
MAHNNSLSIINQALTVLVVWWLLGGYQSLNFFNAESPKKYSDTRHAPVSKTRFHKWKIQWGYQGWMLKTWKIRNPNNSMAP